MKRTIWILAGLVAVLTVVTGIPARSFFGFGTRVDPQEAQIVEQELEARIFELTQSFKYSKATPVFQGDTFPKLTLPVLRGQRPNWGKPTVVTVGISASSSALELYNQLVDKKIQRVHILSGGLYIPQELEAFPTNVTILDGTSSADSLNVSDEVHHLLGVSGTSGYLLENDRTVLFAQVNKGNFTSLETAVESFLQGGARGVRPNTQQLLPIGKPLPLANVPTEFRDELSEALSKPVTLVFLSDSSWCDTCKDWLAEAEPFIETWRERGYGLVTVEGGSKDYALETLTSGIVRLSDVHLSDSETESQVLASWGMTGIPATLVLKDGVLQGEVSWLEVEINSTPYRDIHFRAVEEVTETVAAASVQ